MNIRDEIVITMVVVQERIERRNEKQINTY